MAFAHRSVIVVHLGRFEMASERLQRLLEAPRF